MSAAERAIANAIPLEVKKDGLQQRQNGDWVLRMVVQAADMDPRLTNAPMGTRYQLAMVEIGDDEQPKGRTDWRDLQPAAQAGIRCADKRFHDFLAVEYGFDGTPEQAPDAVRSICGVKSRSELSSNHRARVLWHQLDAQFLQWGGQ